MRRLYTAILVLIVALALGVLVVMVQPGVYQTIEAIKEKLGAGAVAPRMTPNPFGTPEALTEAMALHERVRRQVAGGVTVGEIDASQVPMRPDGTFAPLDVQSRLTFGSGLVSESWIVWTDGRKELRVSETAPGDVSICLDRLPCLPLHEVRALVAGKGGK